MVRSSPRPWGCLAIALGLAGCSGPRPPVVQAAASTAGAVAAILGDTATVNAGSTAALAHQLDAGLHASVFVSAHPTWTAHVTTHHGGTAHPVARNRLVLAAPAGQPAPRWEDLADATCIVTGDPTSVPLGQYTQAALTQHGSWPALAPRIRGTLDAAAAAATLAQGHCPVGILYATDAVRPGLVMGDALPDALQPDIRYELIVLDAAGEPLAARLRSPEARAVWSDHGFGAP